MKINLGCGSTPLEGYINVDMDTLEDLRTRYPNRKFADDIIIKQWNIFDLPIENDAAEEVRSDCLFEHLNFIEEKRIFYEVKRVLKVGGVFNLSVPDFEQIAKLWLDAKDDWKDWFRDDDEAIQQKHWFGTYEYSFKNKWGFIIPCIFGSQNGEGQYHKNCYTLNKLKNIFEKLEFNIIHHEYYQWPRGDAPIIRVIGQKR